MESAGRKSTGARRLGIKVMTGVLTAGLVAGLGATEAARAQVVPVAGEGPAGARIAGTGGMRVLPLGDSITLGTGSPTRSSYRMALAQRLLRGGMQINYVGSQANGSGGDTRHEGHGGWDIDEMATEVDGWLADARPDIVLLHAGTNNITKGDGPYETNRKLSALIDQIRAARPAAFIFVAQIIGSRVPWELADDRIYNRLIPGMVAAKQDPLITVVDQSTVGGIDLHDLHHPNDFGYSKMAWNFYRAMSRVFHTSGDTGPNPYAMQSTRRCLAAKVVQDGEVRHRTECRIWKLRTVTRKIDGETRRLRTWQTLRTVKQAYRVRVGGKMRTRTRLVSKWTGPGNLATL
ncbi:SGNH/GDSL hydrolase family protein [Actinoplanes auranticolor]|uniref:SGNH hydrolase-type esterase domain-containing protein n=1 Tax=Actinoplanes auranticolor TaxID=47988 RepID=A0A919VUI8_9ACTN|nr:SGNH/GDSL hydrolase family protein [Actinoplanes auranticolor]GIM76332.1 hypothetical protein Aau02nite_70380 [Actinoplanes auranticolor]